VDLDLLKFFIWETRVNNFTMTQVNPPVAGEIANQNNQKPLVEVSNNPLGHERTEGKIAS